MCKGYGFGDTLNFRNIISMVIGILDQKWANSYCLFAHFALISPMTVRIMVISQAIFFENSDNYQVFSIHKASTRHTTVYVNQLSQQGEEKKITPKHKTKQNKIIYL